MINRKCSGCQCDTPEERSDNYGIYTGFYCDKCYDNPEKYPFHKDDYFDASYAGECLDEDY